MQVSLRFIAYSPESLPFEALYRPLHLFLLMAVFSFMSAVIDHADTPVLAYQGLATRGLWIKDTLRGFLLGLGLIGIAVAAIAVFGHYGATFRFNVSIVSVLLCVWVLATAAMLEEVMFRGYPFQRLVEAIGAVPATVVVAILFASVHLKNPSASLFSTVNTALVGVLFSVAYLRTRMLWLPFGIHFGWNLAMGMLFGLPVSGTNLFSVAVEGTTTGPQSVTGGAYGIEASVTASVVIVLGIAILFCFPSEKTVQQSTPAAVL